MKYGETTLQSWTSPLSTTEEQRVENTIRMIKNAIGKSIQLGNYIMEVFAQGSYANNTNVRRNSDVDICVMLTSFFFGNYVSGKSDVDYGHNSNGGLYFSDYKAYILDAMIQKFGNTSVTVKNKSINIEI